MSLLQTCLSKHFILKKNHVVHFPFLTDMLWLLHTELTKTLLSKIHRQSSSVHLPRAVENSGLNTMSCQTSPSMCKTHQ
ncbi:hypothetical protein NPIL_570761 [Nephila pilipes]|uniref:Uncharacterized protein n=1 Tax=Nephila pilipes TaxID=299642 RepID=A0A8X6U7G9_NEPPI|nr:hypothetical protein NPIL_570761 [Nephila pilipes]